MQILCDRAVPKVATDGELDEAVMATATRALRLIAGAENCHYGNLHKATQDVRRKVSASTTRRLRSLNSAHAELRHTSGVLEHAFLAKLRDELQPNMVDPGSDEGEDKRKEYIPSESTSPSDDNIQRESCDGDHVNDNAEHFDISTPRSSWEPLLEDELALSDYSTRLKAKIQDGDVVIDNAIYNVKAKIHDDHEANIQGKEGIPPEPKRFASAGKQLEDCKTPLDYNIQLKAKIQDKEDIDFGFTEGMKAYEKLAILNSYFDRGIISPTEHRQAMECHGI